jgi:hypothetical protein
LKGLFLESNWFYQIINPDRLIDKFTGKEGLFENSPLMKEPDKLLPKQKMPLGILIDKVSRDRSRLYTDFQIR